MKCSRSRSRSRSNTGCSTRGRPADPRIGRRTRTVCHAHRHRRQHRQSRPEHRRDGRRARFESVVYMSIDAKPWKKARLRKRGVRVIEHDGDYAQAVAAGRAQARDQPRSHFVDDEGSLMLFLGYAASARHLAAQLADAGRRVDATHPLFVHLPCGSAAHRAASRMASRHCSASTCIASLPNPSRRRACWSSWPPAREARVRLRRGPTTGPRPTAVAQASHLVSPLMASLLSGVFTVSDAQLYAQLLAVQRATGVELEPSAAAAVSGPGWLTASPAGRDYVHRYAIDLRRSTHVIWATGGSLVPPEEHRRFQSCESARRCRSQHVTLRGKRSARSRRRVRLSRWNNAVIARESAMNGIATVTNAAGQSPRRCAGSARACPWCPIASATNCRPARRPSR